MLITAKEAATILHCHPETIRRWCRDGKIPYEYSEIRKNGLLVDSDDIYRSRLHAKGPSFHSNELYTMGDRLIYLRTKKQQSIIVASYYLHMDERQLSLIERNKKVPALRVLKKLARYYGVTTDYLLCMDLEEDYDESKA